MHNLSFIVLMLCPILLVYIILYIYLKTNLNKYNNNIIEKGYEVQAQVMGYVYRSRQNCVVLKFTDINNKEHIIIETSKPHNLLMFNVGDIVTIKYLEQREIDNVNIVNHEFFNQTDNRNEVQLYSGDFKNIGKINLTDNNKVFSILILDKPTHLDKTILPIFIFGGLAILSVIVMTICSIK